MKHEVHSDGSETLYWQCPGCVTPHSVYVKAGTSTEPARPIWGWNGSVERCTLTPSVNVTGRRVTGEIYFACHVFIRDGMIQFLSDCTHALAGQTVPVP